MIKRRGSTWNFPHQSQSRRRLEQRRQRGTKTWKKEFGNRSLKKIYTKQGKKREESAVFSGLWHLVCPYSLATPSPLPAQSSRIFVLFLLFARSLQFRIRFTRKRWGCGLGVVSTFQGARERPRTRVDSCMYQSVLILYHASDTAQRHAEVLYRNSGLTSAMILTFKERMCLSKKSIEDLLSWRTALHIIVDEARRLLIQLQLNLEKNFCGFVARTESRRLLSLEAKFLDIGSNFYNLIK